MPKPKTRRHHLFRAFMTRRRKIGTVGFLIKENGNPADIAPPVQLYFLIFCLRFSNESISSFKCSDSGRSERNGRKNGYLSLVSS